MSDTETDVVHLSGHKLFVSPTIEGGMEVEMVTDGRPPFRMKLTLSPQEARWVGAELWPRTKGISDLDLTEEESIEVGQALRDAVETGVFPTFHDTAEVDVLVANAKAREQASLAQRIDAEVERERERLGRELTGREVTKIERRVEEETIKDVVDDDLLLPGAVRVFIAVGPEGRREMNCDTHEQALAIGLRHLRSGHWSTFTIEERWYANREAQG